MANRAPDIVDLEKMLNDGEGDRDLCARSKEIFERLRDEAKRYQYSGNLSEKARVKDEVRDFANVIKEIEERRHEHALDEFKQYLESQPD